MKLKKKLHRNIMPRVTAETEHDAALISSHRNLSNIDEQLICCTAKIYHPLIVADGLWPVGRLFELVR